MSGYSDFHREQAIRMLAVRDKLHKLDDPDLWWLMENRDFLYTENQGTHEIHAEWGEQARRYAPLPAEGGCPCSTCAITRALNKATGDRDPVRTPADKRKEM